LKYCRSRFILFVFFLQKLKGISSGYNNKSCRIIHNGSNRICFAFLRFFCDFIRNLQETEKWQHYWSYPFARRTLENFAALQCGPWGGGRCGVAKFRRTSPGFGRWRAGEGPRGAKGSVWGIGLSGEAAVVAVGGAPRRLPLERLLR
jgi:hypothetical protein